jgi:hypothetical protein
MDYPESPRSHGSGRYWVSEHWATHALVAISTWIRFAHSASVSGYCFARATGKFRDAMLGQYLQEQAWRKDVTGVAHAPLCYFLA